jgi:hypothetical protein
MANNKKKSLKEQKARKQKIILAVGGAALVLVLIIQAPRILSMVHGGGGESSAEPYKAFPGAVVQSGEAKPISVSSSGKVVLPDADQQPEPGTGQLVDFALFPSKDPFVQQVKPQNGEGASEAEGAPASKGEGGGDQSSGGGDQSSGGSGSEGSGAGGVQIEEAAPSSVTISVNGSPEDVQVGGKFPSGDPAFVLVSATHSSARIGIAGGSLASGDDTVTLRQGHTLTLVNTVDGTEYHLKLVSLK